MKIEIEDLRLSTVVGVYDWEQEGPRELVVDLQIDFDGAKAAKEDNLAHSIDYAALVKEISQHLAQKRYQLIETVASDIADIIMQNQRAAHAIVKVKKAGAITFTRFVSVVEERFRAV